MAPERSPENATKTITAVKYLMEQRPTSELLIAGKLETLPVPDMADAIWARIELQLDIDLPTDDGGGNGPAPSKPSGPSILGWGLSVVLVALITTFLPYKNTPKTAQPEIQAPVPVTQQVNPPEQKNTEPPQPERTTISDKNTTKTATPEPSVRTPQDSVVQQPVVTIPSQTPDSATNLSSAPLVTTPAPKDSIQSPKKKRGVSGLQDGDYRIVPATKDSS
jgi:hypothetical protein